LVWFLFFIHATARTGYLKSLYTLTQYGRNSTHTWPRPWYGNELGCELVIKDAWSLRKKLLTLLRERYQGIPGGI